MRTGSPQRLGTHSLLGHFLHLLTKHHYFGSREKAFRVGFVLMGHLREVLAIRDVGTILPGIPGIDNPIPDA